MRCHSYASLTDGNVVKVDEHIEKCLSGEPRKIKVDLKKSSGKSYQKTIGSPISSSCVKVDYSVGQGT